MFAIQEEIARNIVRAYDFYLNGRKLFHQGTRQSIRRASGMFARAIDEDEQYALALAELADCYSYLFMYFDMDQDCVQRSDAASTKAVELDPELAEAHAARALAVSLNARYAESELEFDRAIGSGYASLEWIEMIPNLIRFAVSPAFRRFSIDSDRPAAKDALPAEPLLALQRLHPKGRGHESGLEDEHVKVVLRLRSLGREDVSLLGIHQQGVRLIAAHRLDSEPRI